MGISIFDEGWFSGSNLPRHEIRTARRERRAGRREERREQRSERRSERRGVKRREARRAARVSKIKGTGSSRPSSPGEIEDFTRTRATTGGLVTYKSISDMGTR